MAFRFSLLLTLCLVPFLGFGQQLKPVIWSLSQQGEGSTRYAVATAKIEKGWHLYDLKVPEGGPIATSMEIIKSSKIKPKGKAQATEEAVTAVDKAFSMELKYFKEEAQFKQAFKLKGNPAVLKVELEYMLCNDEMCLPPTNKILEYDIQ